MVRLAWPVAFGTGWMVAAALQTLQPALLAPAWRWSAAALALLGLAVAAVRARRPVAAGAPGSHRAWAAGLVAALCLGSALGWAVTEIRAGWRLERSLDPALEGEDLDVVGVVVGLPLQREEGLRFRFEIESARHQGRLLALDRDLPRQVSLGWYGELPPDAADLPGPAGAGALRVGDRWELRLRLRRPHGSLNPHGFDYELWMFEQDLRAVGYVRPGRGQTVPRWLGPSGRAPLERLRQRWRDALRAEVGERPAAGVLAALALGEQAAIDRTDWEVFRSTGVAHLMAISGLHVTLIAWLCAGLVAALWRRLPGAALRLSTPLAARWGGLAAALLYALLAGWGVPAQRTVLMLAVLTLLRTRGVRWPGALVLWAAGWAVLLFDPWAWLQPGFWLSFVAVALLMGSDRLGLAAATGGPGDRAAWAEPAFDPAALGPDPDRAVRLRRWLHGRVWPVLQAGWRSQWVASVGLAPWTLLFFQQVSLVGLLANLWAVPLVTLVITPLALLGLAWAPLWSLAAWGVEQMMIGLAAMAAWPWASHASPAVPGWAWALALAGAAWLVLPLPLGVRLPGLCLLLPALWPAPVRPAVGEFELIAADVGQGSAVLLRTRHHSLLYDSGARFSAQADAGSRVLQPLLRALGVARLDLLLLSHRDGDHIGGAESLLRQPGARRLLSSLENGHPLRTRAVHQRCQAGQVWIWDDVRFEILHPGDAEYRRAELRQLSSNGLSCVLRVQGRSGSVLLPGDIEAAQEQQLVNAHSAGRLDLRARVLLLPHHGSRSSSTEAFLRAVQPAVAVAQAGWRNRWGHPDRQVLERLRWLSLPVLRSDLCGAWRWSSTDVQGRCERGERRRYWHVPVWGDSAPGDGLDIAKDPPSNQPSR